MAKSSADDEELRRACQAAIEGGGTKQKVVLSIRVAKSRGIWGKSGRLGRHMTKPRILAITSTYILSCIHSAIPLSMADSVYEFEEILNWAVLL
ncbi:Exocyst complex component S3A [Asimina triloba]